MNSADLARHAMTFQVMVIVGPGRQLIALPQGASCLHPGSQTCVRYPCRIHPGDKELDCLQIQGADLPSEW
jgi:hypothetical protein